MKKIVFIFASYLCLFSCLSLNINDGLTVKIKRNCRAEIIKYAKENPGYKIVGDYIRCENLELKNKIIKFIVFHDNTDSTTVQYSKIKYMKDDNIVREAIVPNPYYTVLGSKWGENKIITQADLNTKTDNERKYGFDKITDFDYWEIKNNDVEFKDVGYYFTKYEGRSSRRLKYEFIDLKDSNEFISYLIDNGFFVYGACIDGALIISSLE